VLRLLVRTLEREKQQRVVDSLTWAIERQRATNGSGTGAPNNAMQLTKLRAAPVLQAEVPPCAPAGEMDGGTASQLIASVRRTSCWSEARHD
jgi:hypothetical protein